MTYFSNGNINYELIYTAETCNTVGSESMILT
jgi:hypothetical protein